MRKIVILLTAILGVAFVAAAFNKAAEIEEQDNKALATIWFSVDASGASNPSNPDENEQLVTAQLTGSPGAPCTQTSGEMCASQVEYDANNSSIQALLDRVAEGDELPSVAEFTAAGATVQNTSHKP